MRIPIAHWMLIAVAAVSLPAAPAAAQATPEVVEIPLRAHGDRLWVPVAGPEGRELAFVLSTGTAVTVLSETDAARLDGATLSLGGIELASEGAHTLADDRLTHSGMAFDGMVGSNTLNRFDMLVDLPGGRLVLKPIGPAVDWPGMELSPPTRLRVFHGIVLSLDVELNGLRMPAMLDLGSDRLLANARAVAEAGVEGGVGTLSVGDTDFAGLSVAESDHPVIGRFSPAGDPFVIVGAPLARGCAIAVSWVHAELRTCRR